MSTSVRGLAIALLPALGLLLAAVPAAAEGAEAAAKPMVVKIHADWCGICRHLDATFEALERELGGEARLVVQAVAKANGHVAW